MKRYVVGKTRFRVNTKRNTMRFGHVGTLVGAHTGSEGTTLTLEFSERSGEHRETFRLEELQRVYMTTPKED